MKITHHFEERLKERFNYEFDTLRMDIEKNHEEILLLTSNSSELELFPQFKNTFPKYPNSVLILYQNLNICMVSTKDKMITCYPIN